MKRRVLILGAGFGGLELATRLSETASDAVDVTLLDRNDSFFFGFSKLEVMLGRQSADDVRLPYRDLAKDGVEFRQETVVGIDPEARRVETDVGTHDADFLVVAMGADYDIAATPGFEEDGYEYYSLAGAERLRDALADFEADAFSFRCSGSRSSVRRRRSRGRSFYMSTSRNGESARPWRWRRCSRCSAPCR